MDRGRLKAGFTLIEMLVTITIIGLAMTAVFNFGRNMLPQQRLKATATDIGDALAQLRTHALFTQREVLFEYHLDVDEQGFSAVYPVELDEADGRILGPGTTSVLEFRELRSGMAIEKVSFPGGEERSEGLVSVAVSPLGRVPSHSVVVINPEFPEFEVYTVRFDSLKNGYRVLEGRPEALELSDVDFR